MDDSRLEATDWTQAFSDLPPRVRPREVGKIAQALRFDLQTVLAGLSGDLGIKITRYNIAKALTCPASAADMPFVPNAILTSRALGLRAIEGLPSMSGLFSSVDSAIETAIDEAHWTAGFLEGQDDASRASTFAYALSWASRALSAAPADVFRDGIIEHKPTYFSPFGFKSPVALVARPDIVVNRQTDDGSDVVLLSFAWPDVRAAALDALVHTFTRDAPQRYLISYSPGGSLHRLDIDVDTLNEICKDIVQAVAAIAPSRRGEQLFADPGPACWNCEFLVDCPTGHHWTRVQQRRRAGLPV